MREQLLQWIDQDREKIIDFIRGFVRAATPNPPGDTLAGMSHVRELLDKEGSRYDLRVKEPTMPNLVAASTFGGGDKHLVLNGHIDVFPVENASDWSHNPWAAEVRDGCIYGRGVADMKVGTTASIFTFLYLQRIRESLGGKLTLTVVSDEETFGPNGARHLFQDHESDVYGTSCLNGEPSSPFTVRFGEKGAMWLRFTITTPGGHGAYAHLSPNAIELAYGLINDLRAFTHFKFEEPEVVVRALEASRTAFDQANGEGASRLARAIVMNVGTMHAGPKVNMIASRCEFEVDFRLPNGVSSADLVAHIESLKARHAFDYEVLMVNEPNWCDPNAELMGIVQRNAEAITGIRPAEVLGMGNTDARLWRYRKIPAVVYGPTPLGMGGIDERVAIEDALNVIRVHVLSAYDYLKNESL